MGIVYRRPGEKASKGPGFLSVPPDKRVRIIGRPNDHVFVDLHWVGQYSVPCYGEECELCHTPKVTGAYVAVAQICMLPNGKHCYRPSLLYVTDSAIALAAYDHRNEWYDISRRPLAATGRMIYDFVKQSTDAAPELFEFKDYLEQLWASRSRVNLCLRDAEPLDKGAAEQLKFRRKQA